LHLFVCNKLGGLSCSGHWIWGGGWLAQLGFHDFAGSTAVHMVGGLSAFIGAAILGPRIGKYDKNGKPRAIPGHNMTFAALGVFLLWFCWFGFNGASSYGVGTVDASGQYVSWGKWLSQIFVTTNLAPCVAADVCLIVTWIRYKKPDVSMCLNGCLAGLVAITAGCDAVTPVGAALIGAISGLIVIFGVEFLDKVIKVDDPVGAVAVHGMNGAFGTIAVGLFATKNGIWGAIAGNTTWGAAFKFLGVQFLGVISVAAWTALCMVVLFTVLKKTIGLRVSAQVELEGLDIHEHGLVSAYSGFAMEPDTILMEETIIPEIKETESPVYKEPSSAPVTVRERKMTQVTMLIRYEKLDALKQAMNSIGVAGMTITEVVGCGMQKIKEERALYRGDPVDVKLKPRLKVEIVISAIPVKTVIDKAKEVLYTGKFGDGKIFVTDVEDVIKVRTGENGYDALQD